MMAPIVTDKDLSRVAKLVVNDIHLLISVTEESIK